MTGTRWSRLLALVISAILAGLVLLATDGGATSVAGPPIDCEIDPEAPECTTVPPTTEPDTTTTAELTTTTAAARTTTTRRRTTSTAGQEQEQPEAEVQAGVVQGTTSTTVVDVSTSVDVLVPGDGSDGAESTTTTTTEQPRTVTDDGTSDTTLVGIIVGGLVLLALVVGLLTWRYWAATRPPSATAVGSSDG